MSRESLTWLNTNTLIGFTDKRGKAWHWRAQEQDGKSNHYPGPIPVADVQDRLFGWTAESRRLATEVEADPQTMTHLSEDGQPKRWLVVPDRQAICRSDDDSVMGIFGPGYVRHQYREWLLTTVADLLDDDLAISSAGLLRGGAIAWVEVSMPDTITTPEGVAFRPNLLATTSFDGSIATTYKRTVTDTVCDNTRELALTEVGQEFKIKHSRHSRLQLAPARQALEMVHSLAEEFSAEVGRLCDTPVNHYQWQAFLDRHAPRRDPRTGAMLEGRALTLVDRKRGRLELLYRADPRVRPWTGTAHGVLQAVNTYEHHVGTVRGDRAERNSLKTVNGDFGHLDRKTWRTLEPLLAAA
jgi:phage/plasmid-like protein (TIGR03299 family)